MNGAELASRIDYAYLKVDSSTYVKGLRQAVETAIKHRFRSLTIPPVLAGTVKKNFPDLNVSVVVAYPLGMDSLRAKAFTISELANYGVDEVDVVYDLFALVNGNQAKIEQEANELGEITAGAGIFHKAIIETPILDDEKIRLAVEILRDSPVDCVKTSTGYGREATSLDHVRLIRQIVRDDKLVKASGGIRNLYDMRAMLEAGADIVGTSAAVAILEEAAVS